jgi:metal iron transporter
MRTPLITNNRLYQACGILGATVMPHSLFLGSGIVQARLKDFDNYNRDNSSSNDRNISPERATSEAQPRPSDATSIRSGTDTLSDEKYRPTYAAIKACMSYSIIEMAFALFTFALFVNSAILIVAGASLYGTPDAADADLFGIHDLLSSSIAPAAGTIFALALLLSGTSAGIVCTIAGQMVSEGMLNWRIKPWMRRLATRSISITPSIIIAGAIGRPGLSKALEASQVVLSIILPFVSAPLIWFTCRARYMTVAVEERNGTVNTRGSSVGLNGIDGVGSAVDEETRSQSSGVRCVQMKNHWVTAGAAVVIWGVIVVMNVALLVLVGMGKN